MDQVTPDSGKKCPDCGELKPLTEFPRNARRRDGYGLYCKACFAVRYRRHRERQAAEEGRTIREWRNVPEGQRYCPDCKDFKPLEEFPRNRSGKDGRGNYCKPCHNARSRANRIRAHGSTRDYHLRRRYGITSADVDAMVEAQGGTCAVCPGKPEHVDHDHETGKVRGVLCFNCNQALGNARDDVAVLDGLIRYLSRHRLSLLRLPPGESPLEDVVFELAYRHLSA